jgi:hypothetical protein
MVESHFSSYLALLDMSQLETLFSADIFSNLNAGLRESLKRSLLFSASLETLSQVSYYREEK